MILILKVPMHQSSVDSIVAENIKTALRRSGRSAYSVATAIGHAPNWLYRVVNQDAGILLPTLREVADELGITVGSLVDPPSSDGTRQTDLTDPEALAGPKGELIEFPAGAKPIVVHRLATAAGSGALDLDESVKTYAWFRSEWLSRKGLVADQCAIISVMGESMDPALPDGCVILIDRNRTRLRSNRIFVLRTEDGLIVKRAGRNGRRWLMVSDNDNGDWPTLPWPREAKVIGQVVWSAQELLL